MSLRAKYTFRTQIYINIQVNIRFIYSFEPCFPFKFCKHLSRYVQSRIQFSKYLQARINQDFKYLFLTKQESSKIFKIFLHIKQESSKTTDAREGSIKINTRVLTPSKIFKIFLHIKQESSKTTDAREGSIKIEVLLFPAKFLRK
jgi:hypothetical protein